MDNIKKVKEANLIGIQKEGQYFHFEDEEADQPYGRSYQPSQQQIEELKGPQHHRPASMNKVPGERQTATFYGISKSMEGQQRNAPQITIQPSESQNESENVYGRANSYNKRTEKLHQKHTPKNYIGRLIVDDQLSKDISELDKDIYEEMMEQLHPLRGAEIADIFPVMNFMKAGKDSDREVPASRLSKFSGRSRIKLSSFRKTMNRISQKDDRRASVKRDLNILQKAGTLGQKALKEIEFMTLRNKYVEGITKNSQNVLKKIHSSDDPLRELGPGISTYHQLLIMLFGLFSVLALLHIPVI